MMFSYIDIVDLIGYGGVIVSFILGFIFGIGLGHSEKEKKNSEKNDQDYLK